MNVPDDRPAADAPPAEGSPWNYNACWASGSQVITAMAHFYRAEVQRSNTWRNRLDTTFNWAIVTAGAALTFTFSSPESPHFVILLVVFLVMVFLGIEARRYRYYELWAYRVRMMETDFYAGMLTPPFAPSQDWADELADNLLHPEFTISQAEALGRRFRRNYVWVFLILGLSWWLKILMHPTSTWNWAEIISRAAVGPLPGSVVIGIGAAAYVGLALLGALTLNLQESTSEVLAPPGRLLGRLFSRRQPVAPSELRSTQKAGKRRPSRQQMATIITTHGHEIASRLMSELHCGVTGLSGQGMYSGQPRDVLLCVLPANRVLQLRAIAREMDPGAFIVVNPADEVAGRGFAPL